MERRALVTGADRGLGRALVEGLAARGWTVFAGLLAPEREAPSLPPGVRPVPLDVRSDVSVQAAARTVGARTDALDLVINNAGILGDFTKSIHDQLDFEDMKATYDVNALGALRVAEALWPLLRRGSGPRLVSISSEAGSFDQTRSQDRRIRYGYCMSKSALNAAMLILGNSGREDGVAVTLLEPGWIRSYMHGEKNLRATLEPEEAAADILDTLARGLPPGTAFVDRHGEPYAW